MTTFSETTLPCLIFTLPSGHPKGSADGLGRLIVNEAGGVDQGWVIYGVEQNDAYAFTDSSGSGALFYEAESRTVMGGAAVGNQTGFAPSPAGSTTSNVVNHTNLSTQYIAVLSTQASGGGAHLSHVGAFRVFLRSRCQTVTANDDSVYYAFEWSYGDFLSYTRNAEVYVPEAFGNSFALIDLGIVDIPPAVGLQRWEGRVIAKGAASGADIQMDCLFLVPIDTCSGEASGIVRPPSLTAFVALDTFQQTVGPLTGKTSEVGGTWLGAGDADDFAVVPDGGITGLVDYISRTAFSDTAGVGRYVTLDVNQAGVYAFAPTAWSLSSNANARWGLVLRYVDTNNWVMARLNYQGNVGGAPKNFEVVKKVAGTTTTLATAAISIPVGQQPEFPYGIECYIDTAGRFVATLTSSVVGGVPGTSVVATLTGQDTALATGGAIATGDVGCYGENTTGVGTAELMFIKLVATAYVLDAAIYANQSIEFRHDRVVRENSTGVLLQPVSNFEGDYLRLLPTGREQRQTRVIVKASQSVPLAGNDGSIDDINATLAYVPRYLSVPTP